MIRKTQWQDAEILSQISHVLELEQQHKEEIKILKSKKEHFKKTVLELNELLNQDSEDAGKLSTSKSEIQRLQEERAKLEVKQAGMREILGSKMAVQKVLENKQKLGEIYGTVAELGQTETKYALALEVAPAQKVHSIVVEDDQATLGALQALLEAKNYDVLTARNGNEAVQQYKRSADAISLVVSDVVMPQMDGVKLYRILGID